MVKRILITIIVCLGMLAMPLGGSQQVQDVAAEDQAPPTLSNEGFQTPESLEPIFEPTGSGGPASDDYLPPEEIQPPTAPADVEIPLIPTGNTLSDSALEGTIQACNSPLWNNGPLVTHPGGGYNGSDLSVLQTTLGMNTYGFSHNHASGHWVTDDFTIYSPEDWQIQFISFFAYETGSFAYPPASTITGVYLRILDGPPDDPASNLVFGDRVTNRMVSTYWTDAYRAVDYNAVDPTRPIMGVDAAVGISLPPGTYWLEWSVSGSLGSGPWVPPITILGQTTTGNAKRSTDNGATWADITDTGTLTVQGLKFTVVGCASSQWLWNQPLEEPGDLAYVDQEFPDAANYSSYLADDFVVTEPWLIDSIFVPGGGWNGFSSLFNATALDWKIYNDNGGIPSGFPPNFGGTPVWSLSAAPTDPRVTIWTGRTGLLSDTVLTLPTSILLQPGHYWLLFYPTMSYSSYGQFGLSPATTSNGNMAKFINPNNGFGYGSGWLDWTITGAVAHDFAFGLHGEVVGNWKSIAPIISAGRSRAAAEAVNGAIYLFGGEITGGGRANTVERYDPKTNTWTTMLGTMPFPASNICAAAIGTDIYIPGGWDAAGTTLSTLQVYHTSTDTWSTITSDPLPNAMVGAGCAALYGRLFVFGGTDGVYYTNAAHVYDPSAAAGSRWTSISSMNMTRAYLAGVTINGKIYAVGGRDSAAVDFSSVEAYDPADDTWHLLTHMQTARGAPGAYAVGKYLYVCGGGWNQHLKTCERYDTDQGYSGVWKSVPALLLQSRRSFAYASIGPTLYAVAGWAGNYLASAERWSYEVYMPLLRK